MSRHAAPEISLRPALADDDDFARRLFAGTRATEFAALGAGSPAAAEFIAMQYRWQQTGYRARHPGALCEIVQAGGPAGMQAIGRLWVDRSTACWQILDIALLPEFRGAGLGGRLLRALLADAAARGCDVALRVEAGNRARRLYERLGFVAGGAPSGLHVEMRWTATDTPSSTPPSNPCPETVDEQA